MSSYKTSYVKEPFVVDESARSLFEQATKGRVSLGALIEAKNSAEGGVLTAEVLKQLLDAAKPQDTRLDVVEDGEFDCVFSHLRGDSKVQAQGWTLDNDGKPATDHQTGRPLRAGSFFRKSRKALLEAGLTSVVSRMETLTADLTGKPSDKRLALVGVVCRFHRKDPKHNVLALIGRTTDKATILADLADSEAFYASAAEASAEGAAVKAARARKAKWHDGGKQEGVFVQFGPARLKADTAVQRKTADAIVANLTPESVAGMTGAQLVTALKPYEIDLPEHVAEAIVRSVARAINPPGAATLGETEGGKAVRNMSWQPQRKRGTGSRPGNRPGNKGRQRRSDSEEEE